MPEGFAITALPLAILGIVALALPYLLVPRDTRSHRSLGLGIAVTASVLLILGPILYAVFDTRDLYNTSSLPETLTIARIVIVDSLSATLLWVPILGLVWFGKAQRIEKLRGEDMAKER